MQRNAWLLFFLLGAFSSVQAERADRNQPVKLEADRATYDDVKKIHVFEGNVVLTQGSLVIRTAKLVVMQDEQGFQKGIATGGEGGLARFRQKREGKNEYVEGEGERIEYDAKTEKTEFTGRARVSSGGDEVRGHRIVYDGLSEHYSVTASPTGKGDSARVTAIIQPKNNRQSTPPTEGNK
ncbi:MAG: lipopolysaccharide transport periplasmic protein LptA [Rhodocyclaceae bacterium]|nr:lipopolysaccharide transport periplasmic protein LptA [Rhodocyclaceae bacterium]